MDIENNREFSPEQLKNKRYQRAVSIGAALFLENGIENVKMTDIADECGIGVATLYRYFGTKTEIAVQAMTFLWNDLKSLYSGVFDSEPFISQTGIKQLSDLMRMFLVLFQAHKDFLRLLGEFDRLIIHESVPKKELYGYEQSVINFYPMLKKAYDRGLNDGTVREIDDFRIYYLACAHSLSELCKKFIYGEILPSDDFSLAEKELGMFIDTAVYYLKA